MRRIKLGAAAQGIYTIQLYTLHTHTQPKMVYNKTFCQASKKLNIFSYAFQLGVVSSIIGKYYINCVY